MKIRALAAAALAAAVAFAGAAIAPAASAASKAETTDVTFATFNASLNRAEEGQLQADLSTPDNEQAQHVAETIQRVQPDILLINEFDYDAEGKSVQLFNDNYLNVSQHGQAPIDYPYSWSGPVNTGVPSGMDLDNDGKVDGPNDAFGFGLFPGQYGFVVYSKYPIKAEDVRTFQKFLWQDMPGALLPEVNGEPYYNFDEINEFRLSSKTHADIPVDINGTVVHVLAAHPTPPSFDGDEKRNQKRNHDEIRLWADYVTQQADYLYDDNGKMGGLEAGERFVIMGDYNADPIDGDSWNGAIQQLLDNDAILDPKPTSEGAPEAAVVEAGANANHKADPKYDTANFNDDPAPGNLRVDYVLPNADATVVDTGVFWPAKATDAELWDRIIGNYPAPTSDHRLVWLTLQVPGTGEPTTTAPATTGPTTTAPTTETPTAAPTTDKPSAKPTTEPNTPAPSASPSAAPTTAADTNRPSGLATTGADALAPVATGAAAAAALLGAGAALIARKRREA